MTLISNEKLVDKDTYNLFNGLKLILIAYPESKSGISTEGTLDIYFDGKDSNLSENDKNLLLSWKWQVYYNNTYTIWSYS